MRHLSPFTSNALNRSLFSEFDRFFEGIHDPDIGKSLNFQPRVDVEEHSKHFLLSFDLPGMKEEDINVEVKDNTLTVSGERSREYKSENSEHFKSYERVHGSFARSFSLPQGLESNDIQANYENGVLHVAIPKVETTSSQQVKVQSKKDGFLTQLFSPKD